MLSSQYHSLRDRTDIVSLLQPQFRNFSTGIAFEDVTRKLDDEEGYEKTMQANL